MNNPHATDQVKKEPETRFNTVSGSFLLDRLPKSSKGDLRAWDAADELLLTEVFNNHPDLLDKPVLILNDSFGALAIGLHQSETCSWGDSFVAHQAADINFKKNQIDTTQCCLLPSTELPVGKYPLVLIKIPKTLSLLEEQLSQLKPCLQTDSIIIASGMSRHIHRSTLNLFEKIIGPTHTSRATKKARLIFNQATQQEAYLSPYPKIIRNDQFDLTLLNYANVFSNNQLDIGTRFMLSQLDKCPHADNVIDLGCGNGALGIFAKRLQPNAHVRFIDESYLALKSARESYYKNCKRINDNKVSFDSGNILATSSPHNIEADLILCNPPFHQAHTIGDHIAWQMFKQSHYTLKENGELWVIGNRHMAYHVKLKKVFGNCKTIAANKKFVVLAARKRTKK